MKKRRRFTLAGYGVFDEAGRPVDVGDEISVIETFPGDMVDDLPYGMDREQLTRYVNERSITPSEQLCPKCGSANVQRAFRERGEEWRTYGVSKQRTSTRVTIDKWIGIANQDCIVHHCRCCHFEWDTDALE